MFTYARMRRAATLFLFMTLSMAWTVGPVSAMIPPPPDPDAGGRPPQGNHTDVAASSDPGVLTWVFIGLALALVAAGVVMVALRRHGRIHRVALPSQ